jgi:hypothetical protein
VPTTSAVDATGDTEIFTSQGFQTAQSHAQRKSIPDEDSKRTVPNAASASGASGATGATGASNEALRTAAATPIEMGRDSSETAAPASPPIVSGFSEKKDKSDGGPKTHPLPWGDASSSASGVAMPGTPPIIDPLPTSASDVAPDTQRDEQLAMRAERRRWVTLGAVAVVILAVAIGGYIAGQRNVRPPSATATPTTPTANATMPTNSAPTPAVPSAAATTTVPAASVSAAAAAPAASTTAAATESAGVASAAPTVAPPRVHRKPRRPAAAPPEGSSEAKPAEEAPPPAVPENPFDNKN